MSSSEQPEKVQTDIKKGESHERLTVPSSRELGYNGIVDAQRFIRTAAQQELQYPRLIQTVDKMMQDDAVSTAVDAKNNQTVTSISRGRWVGNTEAGETAAKFLNYCIRNMTYGTWRDACEDFATSLQYGFALSMPVLERRNYGQYSGNYCLRKLSPRSQQSVFAWVWDDPMQNVIGFVQTPKWSQEKNIRRRDGLSYTEAAALRSPYHTYIPLERVLHFRNTRNSADPQGYSQCAGIYETWLEKTLLQHLELTGAQKDLAGTLVVRVPSELVSAANSGTDDNAAAEYRDLQADAANMHQGKSTSMLLLSDRDSSGNFLYDVELKGITGTGKQIEIDKIIDAKRNAIFNKFFAQFLILGQGDVGSNAAALTGKTVHDRFVEYRVESIVETLNCQLAPRLLAANNIFLNDEDMPRFIASDASAPSIDEYGKFLNRVGSLGMVTKPALEHIYRELKLPTEGIDDLNMNEDNISQSGRSFGSSGAGTNNQENSETNPENAS